MVDICMCDGKSCLIKEKCRRFTAIADEWQSYFAKSPIKENGINCDYFMPNDYRKKKNQKEIL